MLFKAKPVSSSPGKVSSSVSFTSASLFQREKSAALLLVVVFFFLGCVVELKCDKSESEEQA